MMNCKTFYYLAILALIFRGGTAYAAVMDFESGPSFPGGVTGPYTQNGLTVTPIDHGFPLLSGNHFDLIDNTFGATPGDRAALIHRGNNAEEVQFTSSSGNPFSLLSIDIETIAINGPPVSLTGTFTSSAGGFHTVSTIGTVDFTLLSDFNNVSWVNFTLPLNLVDCNITTDCAIMVFDNVRFNVVPIPASIWLFGSGMLGLLGLAKRKQT